MKIVFYIPKLRGSVKKFVVSSFFPVLENNFEFLLVRHKIGMSVVLLISYLISFQNSKNYLTFVIISQVINKIFLNRCYLSDIIR